MSDQNKDDFNARIAKAQAERAKLDQKTERAQQKYESISGASMALRLSAEMVSALVVGLFIGIMLDRWFKTSPLFLLIFFGFGLAAGILGGIRAYRNFNAELAARAQAQGDGPTNGTDTP
ncbi:MAG: AtpZ/AtpI family protein [Pseudomonadota bacterium]